MSPNQQHRDLSDSLRRIREALLEIEESRASIFRAAALLSTIEGLSPQWEELGNLAGHIKELQTALENAGRSVE